MKPLTNEDQEFSLRVTNEYKIIPIAEFQDLLREIRDNIQNGVPGFTEADLISPYKELFEYLFPSDAEIKYLDITTNKGTVRIESTNEFFSYFKIPLERMRKKFYKDHNHFMKVISSQVPFNLMRTFLETTLLGPAQKRVIIGMFLCYFKMGKHIMTEQEFKTDQQNGKNPIEAQSYKRYLSDIVKSRLKFFD